MDSATRLTALAAVVLIGALLARELSPLARDISIVLIVAAAAIVSTKWVRA